jgi:hypothetical protein
LADVEEGGKVRVLRFENEAEDLLHYLKDSGLTPGLEGTLDAAGDDEVTMKSNGDSYSVTRSVAETVSVVADPSPPPRAALPDQLVLGNLVAPDGPSLASIRGRGLTERPWRRRRLRRHRTRSGPFCG